MVTEMQSVFMLLLGIHFPIEITKRDGNLPTCHIDTSSVAFNINGTVDVSFNGWECCCAVVPQKH
jgi:hypothetical protein